MSIQAVAWALEQTIQDSAAKLVLISLCNAHNGDTNVCKPSKARLAHEASVSISTVTRKLKYLVEHGWIEKINSFDENGRQASNCYRLIQETDAVDRGVTLTRGGVKPQKSGGVNLGEGVTCDTGEGVNCDTPLKEPEYIPEEIKEKSTKKESPLSELQAVVLPDIAMAIVEHRRTIRKPLTAYAARLLAAEFAKTSDPNEAAREMIAAGWQGFKADWMKNRGEPTKTENILTQLAEVVHERADRNQG